MAPAIRCLSQAVWLLSKPVHLRTATCLVRTTAFRYTNNGVPQADPQAPSDNQLQQQPPNQSGVVPVQQKLIARIPVEYHGVPAIQFNDDTVWLRLFRFPYLSNSKAVIRAKVYLATLSATAIGYHIYRFLSVGAFDTYMGSLYLLWTLGSISLLGIVGNLSKKIICQVYVTEDLKHVRLSRFTFFGKRRDLVLPIDCIVPLTESNRSREQLFLSLEVAKPELVDPSYDYHEFYDDKFLICLKLGGVADVEMFELVFGKMLSKQFY